MIIGLIGRKGSGKGAAAKILMQEHGARVFRMSDVLRSIAKDLSLTIERENLILISETVRKHFGESILGTALSQQILEAPQELIVIDGIRRQADLDGFRDLNLRLVNISAPTDIRFERIHSRGENTGEACMSREQFDALEFASTEVTIREIENQAEITIENSGSFDTLRHAILNLVQS